MLGFHITIYKLQNGSEPAPSTRPPTAGRLAVWQTGIGGLGWIEDLVKRGLAVHIGGFGYPTMYTTTIEHVRPTILEGPPHAKRVWGYDPGDIIQEGWLGKTTIDQDALQKCTPHERVYIEVWDES